jgi:single-stranded-DNA-specific exonuclease
MKNEIIEIIEDNHLSVKGLNWAIRKSDERKLLAIQQKFAVPEIIARCLVSKNIELENIEKYLKPTLKEELPDPLHLIDMEAAVSRLCIAIENNQKIVIFGDYDVDGATSSALLKRFFASVGLQVQIYIPDRIEEGYGPNSMAMKKLKELGAEIVITVDCGIAAFKPLADAKEFGLEVIVVDHHLGTEQLPQAMAIVNPNRLDETSNFGYLAAVGVAFLVAIAINSRLRKKGYFASRKEPDLLSLLDIVALGTICDMVPLEGINRAFVIQGLKVLAKRTNLGLSILADVAGINETPNCYHLGFVLGPRINAGGRVGKSDLGAILLSTDDYEQAYKIAKQLDHYNSERKAIEALVIEEAMLQAEQLPLDTAIILVYSENWHPGVIGIVASRLKDKYNKPTAVISILKDGIGKASCRSVKGIDFGSSIISAKTLGLIIEGGGHAMAAGFSVQVDKISELNDYLHQSFKTNLKILGSNKQYYYDGYLSCNGVQTDIIKLIEKIGPFGSNSHEPRFMIKDCYLLKINILANVHLSCILGHESVLKASTIKATAFRAIDSELGNFLVNARGKKFSVIGYLRINRWNGMERPEMIIEDIIK